MYAGDKVKEEPKQLTSEVYEILQGIVDFPTTVHQPVVEKKVADPSLLVRELAEKLSACFLRNEGRFYHIDAPNVPLARRDMEQSFLNIIAPLYPKEQITNDVLRRVFDVAIERKHSDRTRSIPVWGRTSACHPGSINRVIWLPTGVVELNTWRQPAYRADPPESAPLALAPIHEYLEFVFFRPDERNRVLDWLAWNLQNESKRPAWALLLYSRQKGTGKSTFCDIARKLFGEENTATQNNIDKLASRFNATPLTNKLIISEEFSLRPDSAQSNAIKTYITDSVVLTERKGKEAERLNLVSSFIFTSNHLPTWLEEGERRYYIVETDHDGHASGPKSKEFNQIVKRVKESLESPSVLSALYQELMSRKVSDDFDPHSLNTEVHGTEIMKRVAGASRQTLAQTLEEHLEALGGPVQTNETVKKYIVTELRVSGNSTRHMMVELGWSQYQVKWGGVDYARAIWAKKGYAVSDGRVLGPDGYDKAVEEVSLGEVQL